LMNPKAKPQGSPSQARANFWWIQGMKPKYLALKYLTPNPWGIQRPKANLSISLSFAPCCILSFLIWWRLEGFAPCMNECYVCMSKELESFGWGVGNNIIAGNLSKNL
jgi:hypothetical protein